MKAEKSFKNHLFLTALFLFAGVVQSFSLRAGEIIYTYDFQKEKARTQATLPPAYYTTIGKDNAGTAGVTSYTDANGLTSKVLKAYGVGQRNATAVINLNAFPKKASDYSVTWKQYYDDAAGDYKTGVVLRADVAKVGTASQGYVQGMMNGYVLLPYKKPSGGTEFRIYKSTNDAGLSMLVNNGVSDLSPGAKQAVWYKASVSGSTDVHLTLEYSTDSITWAVGASFTDAEGSFKTGATQILWGLAISRTDFCFDNITFRGVAEDGIDTPPNPEEPSTDVEISGIGGQGKHYKMTIPVKTGTSTATREMIVYVPKDFPVNTPLLISCHGMNQDANFQANQADYWMVADTAKFLTVYPQGINNSWDFGGASDISFMSAIIDTMSARYAIDKKRVYFSGFSMGSMLTYYTMNTMYDKIAAWAPTHGWNRSITTALNTRTIPIIQVLGTDDDVFYKGLESEFWRIFNAFMTKNGCVKIGGETKYPENSATTTSTKQLWRNPSNGIEMVLLLTPKGHWHSNDPQQIMTNLEVWNFCRRYNLDGLIGGNPSGVSQVKSNPGIVATEYYDLMGRQIQNPDKNLKKVYLVKNYMSDGSVLSEKKQVK